MLRQHARLLLLLGVLAGGLHLFKLSEPRSVMFDEVHFGAFINAYCGDGAYFFDIHPPHGKLLIAGVAALGGYRGQQSFETIHTPIDRVSPALLRVVPAIAGILLPLIIFTLLIELGASRWAAWLAALAVTLDNALLIQTRTISLDGILLVATFGAVCAYLHAIRRPGRPARSRWSLGAGLLAGLAVGTKLTGLVAPGLIGAIWLVEVVRAASRAGWRRAASDAVWLASGAAMVYVTGWALHFWLLQAPGPGDEWGTRTGAFLTDTVQVHRLMLAANYGLSTGHNYASAWWSWPLMLRPVSYWTVGGTHLHFLGNPIVWWGSSLGLLLSAAAWPLLRWTELRLPDGRASWPPRMWIVLAGWLLAFGPLTAVPRPLFMYHYLTALLFAICAVALWLDHAGWTRPTSFSKQRPSFHGAIVALVIGFALVSPFTLPYAKFPEYQSRVLELLPSWR